MLKSVQKRVNEADNMAIAGFILFIALVFMVAAVGIQTFLIYFAWNTIAGIFGSVYTIDLLQSFGILVAGWVVKSFFRKGETKVELN